MRLVKIGIVAVVVMFVTAVIWAYDPTSGDFPFPRCPVKTLTGLDCPGCGSTRALHAMLHGHPKEALGYNAGLVVGIPLIAAAFVAERLSPGKVHRLLLSPGAACVVLALALGWMIIRNLT